MANLFERPTHDGLEAISDRAIDAAAAVLAGGNAAIAGSAVAGTAGATWRPVVDLVDWNCARSRASIPPERRSAASAERQREGQSPEPESPIGFG
ncbi:MAG TPA: hypothetical protein VH107_18930 [Lacipirellulaceae bacterium]|nr:hypothetical protein [Lacipirellulaceae bacterium]